MSRERGFTLIELLIVVAIIGILAAIAIPNMITTMQRARQKRTMSDIRAVGTAWEARSVEMGRYNAAGATLCCASVMAISQVQDMLEPTFMKNLINSDAWGHPLEFAVGTNGNNYLIRSPGKDGLKENAPALGPTTDFDCDLIFSDGVFVQYPEGVQGQ